ncbi:MAG: NYN domain-containing protein [Nanoarchaeota archaeon]|nr:NYN domain-containing protein [Nanoarchaeota archaeon]
MEETLVFIDAGFVSKLKKYFGKEDYLRTDLIKLSNNLTKRHNLICNKIFYYTAPPFQSGSPTKEESQRYRNYMCFKDKLSRYSDIIIREGRCQRLKIDGIFKYRQKAVDILLTMDLTSVPINYPNIKQIILMTTDSDFVPIMKNLKQQGIKTILYTYYDRKRNTNFSRSNELIKSVSRYIQLTKQDFEDAALK